MSKRQGVLQDHAKTATHFFAALAICSIGWLGLQNIIPGAKAKGVVAEVIPGATQLQNAILASMGRIETRLDRIGSTLETKVQKTATPDLKLSRRRNQRSRPNSGRLSDEQQAFKNKLQENGYTADADGLVMSWKDGYLAVEILDAGHQRHRAGD